jgi:hypothetical protein
MKKAAIALGLCLALLTVGWALWPDDDAKPAESTPVAKVVPDGPAKPNPRSVDELLAGSMVLSMPDAGMFVISGVVFDADDKPAPGVEVEVFPTESAPSVIAATCDECEESLLNCQSPDTAAQIAEAVRHARGNAVPLATTRTDAEGNFSLPLQWEGMVIVRADDGRGAQTWIEIIAEGEGTRVELQLQQRSRVVGLVTSEESGPVAGARVLLVATSDGAFVEATSAADGSFEVLCPAEPCSLWTFTQAAGYAPLVFNAGMVNSGEDGPLTLQMMKARELEIVTRLGGKPVEATVRTTIDGHQRTFTAHGGTLKLSELGTWEITLEATSGRYTSGERSISLGQPHNKTVLELRASSRALVEVVGPEGNPVNDAFVSIDGPDASASGETGTDGALVVLGPLGEGAYQLLVRSSEGIERSQEVDLVPGDNPITVTLPTAMFLSGKLVDAEGKVPPPTAVVASFRNNLQRMTSDAETGEFKIAVGEAGPWRLLADSPLAGRATATASAPATNLELRFDRRAGISVRVRAEGKPAADVMVAVMPAELKKLRNQLRRRLELMEEPDLLARSRPMSGVTDEEGKLTIWGLEPGEVSVQIADAAFRPVSRNLALADGRLAELDVQLERGATIEGVIVDAQGNPVPAASVSVSVPKDHEFEALASRAIEEEGKFSVAGLESGKTYELTAATGEAESATVKVEAPARGVRLVMAPLPRLRGRVVDERGAPVTHFDVDGQDFDTQDGRFDVPVRPEESVIVFVSAEGYASKSVELKEAGDAGDVVLVRGQVLHGRVVNARGEPVPGALVSCDMASDVTTGADGAFELTIEIIEYPLQIRAARGAVTGVTEANAPGEVVVKLGPRVRVVGRSYDFEGRPAPGSVLARLAISGNVERFEADGQGRFVGELPQGSWEFQAVDSRFSTTVLVTGERVDVSLGGAPGTCALKLDVPANKDVQAMLVERSGRDDELLNLPSDEHLHGELAAAGLKCGAYLLTAIYDLGQGTRVRSFDLELKQPVTQFSVPESAEEPPLTPAPQPILP